MQKTLRLAVALAVLCSAAPAVWAAPVNTNTLPAKVNYPNTKLPVSTNLPVGSIYYDYLEKLDGMGYLTSMLYGTKPYARVDIARWVREAEVKARSKPMPGYLKTMLQELEQEFAPELAQLNAYDQGQQQKNSALKLHSVTAELAYNKGAETRYPYSGPASASWQGFSANNNGHHYGQNTNVIVGGYLAGNLGREVALSVSPRLSWDKDNHVSGAFDEGYLTTRVGIFKLDVGKEAVVWGEGTTGTLGLSNNARPLTMVKLATEERPRAHGLLGILGKTRWTAFVGRLDGERTENGVSDYEHPYFVGVRSDYIYPHFTFGLERLSLLGGDGNAFHFSDTWDWIRGKNAYDHDKWDDIAGIDFKYRFPGMQVYGELYGEDQANYLPSDLAYRGGVYFPQLTPDGSWDLRLEGAHTNNDWYVHGTYQSGWTYHHDILGDAMGRGATKGYVGINHYPNAKETLGLHAEYTKLGELGALNPKVLELWLSYSRKLNSRDRLSALVGWASLKDAGYESGRDEHDKFVKLVWQRSF